jgi:hypothetical protein
MNIVSIMSVVPTRANVRKAWVVSSTIPAANAVVRS